MQSSLMTGVVLGSIVSLLCVVPSAAAAGKKPASPSTGGSCVPGSDSGFPSAKPIRQVVLKPVTTKAFNLPNGSRVDLSADLDLILRTAVAGTNVFAPLVTDGGDPNDFCGNHLEIRAGVSELMLNAFEFGLSIGYTPTGEGSGLTGLTGKTNLRVGTIAMDFSVLECTAGSCEVVAASTASSLTAGVDLSLQVDFGLVKTGPELVFNTPLGGILRGIMNKGMEQLSRSGDLSRLSWKARVREYLPETGTLTFDAGARVNLKPNQAFTVLALNPSTGVCDTFKAVARVHTTQVELGSSTAVVDRVLDARGIRDGDVVVLAPNASTLSR